jgi:hypothetical protein
MNRSDGWADRLIADSAFHRHDQTKVRQCDF